MKIQPGQSAPIPLQPLKTKAEDVKNEPQTTDASGSDFTPTQNNKMLELLKNQPEIRPEVLEKAQKLAADPNYPSTDIVEKLAKLFINDAK